MQLRSRKNVAMNATRKANATIRKARLRDSLGATNERLLYLVSRVRMRVTS